MWTPVAFSYAAASAGRTGWRSEAAAMWRVGGVVAD
jgi:hypothetical protein